MIYNTRVAPSPTGDFHIGSARTAYFSYLAARSTGGKFLLRIDDTDQSRHSEEAVTVIYDMMKWLGLDYDETFRQSEQKDAGIYDNFANMLIKQGKAYKEDGAIRLHKPDMQDTWYDEVAGDIPITEKDLSFIEGLVLIKSDGWPTYHFSSVVDDHIANVNYIIRGNDHLSNTAKHIAIYKQLGFETPKFAHVGLIHKNKKKISKRDPDNSASMLGYKEKGYNPDAILNFLARLGWGPQVDDKSTAILQKDKMKDLFLNGGSMKSSPANFDQAKLDSFDRKYKAMIEKNNR